VIHQSEASPGARRRQFLLLWLRVALAAVWIVFGLVFKVAGLVPRHRLIVAAAVGEAAAGPVTLVVGCAEAALGLWVLSGVRPRTCAAAQTLAIVGMNSVELAVARELLLAPVLMLCANSVLLCAAWWIALNARTRPETA
jgi:uncharacterized membrane protein YphA (DoxX/SURF4 family)